MPQVLFSYTSLLLFLSRSPLSIIFLFPSKAESSSCSLGYNFPTQIFIKVEKVEQIWSSFSTVIFFPSSFLLSQSLLSLTVPLQILSISTTELYQWSHWYNWTLSMEPRPFHFRVFSVEGNGTLCSVVWHVRSNFSVIRNLLVSLLV